MVPESPEMKWLQEQRLVRGQRGSTWKRGASGREQGPAGMSKGCPAAPTDSSLGRTWADAYVRTKERREAAMVLSPWEWLRWTQSKRNV